MIFNLKEGYVEDSFKRLLMRCVVYIERIKTGVCI